MYTKILKDLDQRSRLLFAAQYEALGRCYTLPMQVRLGELEITVRSADDLALHLRRHHVALLRRGVAAMVPEIMAVELPLQDSHRLWLRWHERGGRGGDLRHSEVVYRCASDPGNPLVLGMDYTRLAMPEFARPVTHRRLVV